MLPSDGQIGQAAYERWERRGRGDGLDREDWHSAREELLFRLNYQNILECRLDARGDSIPNDRAKRQCRFCDRTISRADTISPPAVFPGALSAPLFTQAFCEECRAGFRDALAADFDRFWAAVVADAGLDPATRFSRAREHYVLPVYKALIACALAIMPENELRYFPDTLEWVSNLDARSDAQLVRLEASCRVYLARWLGDQAWTSLVRRREADAPFPYMIIFLAQDGVVIQAQLPMCLRDQDLDGRAVRIPRRSFAHGEGVRFQEARSCDLPSPR
jgi:hypothetical protein